jgi:hypothetical protein
MESSKSLIGQKFVFMQKQINDADLLVGRPMAPDTIQLALVRGRA